MAGLYDRLTTSVDNVPVHYLTAALVGVESGWITAGQALTGINNSIDTDLDAAAQTDLTDILAVMSAKPTNQKGTYMHQLESMGVILESFPNTFTDAEFRTHLGI